MGVQNAPYGQDGVRENLRGPQVPQPDDDCHDFRHGRFWQVDARPMRGGGAEGRHQDCARGNLRTARQRHDPAAHQCPQQGWCAGGGELGLWPGPSHRDTQLSPARDFAAPVPEPRGRFQAVHRTCRSRSRRRAPARGGPAGGQ